MDPNQPSTSSVQDFQQPSTSSTNDPNQNRSTTTEEEIQKDAKRLDVRLEDCAKKFNLTSLNVKNIIFHIIKDPHTLAALLDGDENALEHLKLTRSRLREMERIAQTKLNIELKPVNAKSTRPTLLDFEFNDEDEEDSDYMPPPEEEELQETDRYEFEDFTEEELADEQLFLNTENLFGHQVGDEIQNTLNDDLYMDFLTKVADPAIDETYLEENDEDYNVVQDDEDALDMDEFRNDRSTKISKRELRHLYNDIVPDELLYDAPPFKKPKAKRRLSFGSRSTTPSARPNIFLNQSSEPQPSTSTNQANDSYDDLQEFFIGGIQGNSEHSANVKQAWNNIHVNRVEEKQKEKVVKSSGSWSLLMADKEIARFKDDEIQCLRIQMEKHVQLLTQHIVATTNINNLMSTRNQALKMLHELDSQMYSNPQHSIFRVQNLPAAVISCHEIEAFNEELYEELVGRDAEEKFNDGNLQFKSSVVLSKSKALCYPELLPTVQPCLHSTPLSNFITAEQMLLALALFELHHVPHSTGGVGRISVSKYQTISTNFLPNKTSNQIRNHLKNIRSGSKTSPLHQLISFAEQGTFNATVELDNGSTKRTDLPIEWPTTIQLPRWLLNIQQLHLAQQPMKLPQIVSTQQFQNHQQSDPEVLVEYTVEHPPQTPSSSFIQLPASASYSVVQLYDGQIFSPNVVQLSGNSPIVLLNTSGQLVYNQTPQTSSVMLANKFPNSPFQSYTVKMPKNEVIVLDDDNEKNKEGQKDREEIRQESQTQNRTLEQEFVQENRGIQYQFHAQNEVQLIGQGNLPQNQFIAQGIPLQHQVIGQGNLPQNQLINQEAQVQNQQKIIVQNQQQMIGQNQLISQGIPPQNQFTDQRNQIQYVVQESQEVQNQPQPIDHQNFLICHENIDEHTPCQSQDQLTTTNIPQLIDLEGDVNEIIDVDTIDEPINQQSNTTQKSNTQLNFDKILDDKPTETSTSNRIVGNKPSESSTLTYSNKELGIKPTESNLNFNNSNPTEPSTSNKNLLDKPADSSKQAAKTDDGKTKNESEKKSRRLEQMMRCMRGFEDPEVVEMWSSLVLQTVYNLVKQRLFMHDGKFKTFLSVLNNPKKSSSDKYDELSRLLRDTQPELADCIAALMDDEELRADQEQNPERCAYKSALEMLMNIHIYFNGQQNSNMKRRLLKLIRDLCFTEQNLREEMQKLLSGRHEPLWTRLKQHFRGEKYREKFDINRAEKVPLSVFSLFAKNLQGKNLNNKVDLMSEFVDLTSSSSGQAVQKDTDFKPNLRLQSGYFMFRLENGQSVPVNVCSPTKLRDGEEKQKVKATPPLGSIFGPEQDRRLLHGYNESKANLTRAVDKFVREQREHYPPNECPFNEDNVMKRLNFLLELLSSITTVNSTGSVTTTTTVASK